MPAQKGYRSPPSDGSRDSRDSRDSKDSRILVRRDQSSSTQGSKRDSPKSVVLHQGQGAMNDDPTRNKFMDDKKWR